MAEGAAEAKFGSITEKQRDSIRGASAAADNFGNFFAQNLFLGAPGVLLIVSTMAEQGYTQVTPLAVALWSIPVAIATMIFGVVRNFLLDRRLRAESTSGAASTGTEGSVKA